MCYQYSALNKPELLEGRFDARFAEDFHPVFRALSFDLPRLPVITNEKPRQISLFHWGLIPFWVKTKKDADEIRVKTMNARGETLFEKPAFRTSADRRHCLVLADGFFEWRYFHGKNYPYYIRLKDHQPFAMAGLWDQWMDRESEESLYTYTIVTTEANTLMAQVHNKKKRMPVILTRDGERRWIAEDIDKDESKHLLIPYDPVEMEAYSISRLITSKTQNPNVPQVIEPFEYPELPKLNL
jgi:putative SOS response-associated peptidase YedK